MERAKTSKKKLRIVCAVSAAAVVLIAGIVCVCVYFALGYNEPPVIVGVRDSVVVYEDDSDEAIKAALLDGVSAVGKRPCAVQAAVLSKTDGAEVEVQNLTAGEYTLRYTGDRKRVEPVASTLTVKPADTTPPTITGVADKTVYVNGTVSYREGVTVTDDFDKAVQLQVDSSKVDLTSVGKYPVVYSATDSRGNTATVQITVTVQKQPDTTDTKGKTGSKEDAQTQAKSSDKTKNAYTKEELDALCAKILKSILKDGMTQRQKAEAIYNRVHKIKYVNTPDGPDRITDAYIGLSRGSGDCENFSAASGALLTRAGISCYELKRVGGTSEHYWQIAYVDGGWYHFDPCPTSTKYPIRCFLLTDEEVIAYSNSRTDKPNYYIYDHNACPYEVVKSRDA